MAASLVWFIQMSLFLFLFIGENIVNSLGIQRNGLLDYIFENKWTVFFVAFLIGNILQSSLLATKAFEIYNGKHLVWSALEKGHVPQLRDLMYAFDKVDVRFDVM